MESLRELVLKIVQGESKLICPLKPVPILCEGWAERKVVCPTVLPWEWRKRNR